MRIQAVPAGVMQLGAVEFDKEIWHRNIGMTNSLCSR